MKKQIIKIALVVCTAVLCVSCSDPHAPYTKQELKDMLKKENIKFPQQIDEITTLDSISVPVDNTVQYNYGITSITKAEVTEEVKTQAANETKAKMLEEAKKNKDMQVFRDHKVNLNYVYRDKNNEEIYRFTISGDEYGTEK